MHRYFLLFINVRNFSIRSVTFIFVSSCIKHITNDIVPQSKKKRYSKSDFSKEKFLEIFRRKWGAVISKFIYGWKK